MKNRILILSFLVTYFLGNSQTYVPTIKKEDVKIGNMQDLNIKASDSKIRGRSLSQISEKVFTEGRIELPDSLQKNIPAKIERDTSNTNVRIAILMPIEENYAAWKIYGLINAKDEEEAGSIKLKETIREAMDFYEGFKYSIQKNPPLFNLDLTVFDAPQNDSIFKEFMKNDTLKTFDIIIGPGTVNQAKLVTEFCKKYKILNLETFVSAKNITINNPYVVRLKPTIEGHMHGIFDYVRDTVSNPNVIIYSPKSERSQTPAKYLDSLFKEYNAANEPKIRCNLINLADTNFTGSKSIGSYTASGNNVVVITGYEENFIDGMLRGYRNGGPIVFGMPTWLEPSEKIHPDYINGSQVHITDPFYADTSNYLIRDFIRVYNANFAHKPSSENCFGYDTWNYISMMISKYGKNFTEQLVTEPYNGVGHRFRFYKHLRKAKNAAEESVNFYANESTHIYKVENYKIVKVY